MPSTTTSRTAATESQYSKIFQRIERRVALLEDSQIRHSDLPIRIVRYLIQKKPGWSKRTWTLYRCSVRFGFEQALDDPERTFPRSTYEKALSELNQQTQVHARRRGTSTSALKTKTITQDDLDKLRSYLFEHRTQPLAPQLWAYALAATATGLRPSEWEGAELLEDVDGTPPCLRVRNAKAGHGRANGEYRTLQLQGLDQVEMRCVKGMIVFARYASNAPGGYPAWQRRLRHYFARSIRAALGKRQHYPSLYTFRHQFAANAKAVFSQEEVAALMGHASAATAGRNYAKKRQAKSPIGVAPLPAEVRRVRMPTNSSFALRRGSSPCLE